MVSTETVARWTVSKHSRTPPGLLAYLEYPDQCPHVEPPHPQRLSERREDEHDLKHKLFTYKGNDDDGLMNLYLCSFLRDNVTIGLCPLTSGKLVPYLFLLMDVIFPK